MRIKTKRLRFRKSQNCRKDVEYIERGGKEPASGVDTSKEETKLRPIGQQLARVLN